MFKSEGLLQFNQLRLVSMYYRTLINCTSPVGLKLRLGRDSAKVGSGKVCLGVEPDSPY